MGQMDRVTQANAAGAEEGANAAAHLKLQADALQEAVRAMREMMGHTGSRTAAESDVGRGLAVRRPAPAQAPRAAVGIRRATPRIEMPDDSVTGDPEDRHFANF
jgi:hypothetical protein